MVRKEGMTFKEKRLRVSKRRERRKTGVNKGLGGEKLRIRGESERKEER